MATATTTTKAAKGFTVRCPYRDDPEATVTIDLNKLHVIRCSACDEEFSAEIAVLKATEQLRRWEAVARWVARAAEAMADPE